MLLHISKLSFTKGNNLIQKQWLGIRVRNENAGKKKGGEEWREEAISWDPPEERWIKENFYGVEK